MAKTYAMRTFALLGLASWLATSPAAADKTKDWYESEGDEEARDEDDDHAGDEDAGDEDGEHDEFATDDEQVESENDIDAGGTDLAPGAFSLYAGTLLGFGGSQRLDTNVALDFESDLSPTYGLQLGGDCVLHRLFALGAELRALAVATTAAANSNRGRDLYLDFVVKPRVRYPFRSSGLEVYLAVPVGATLPVLADAAGIDTSVGVTIGVGVGVLKLFTEHWGLGGDFGWLWHRFHAENTNLTTGRNEQGSYDTRQVTMFVNLVYAL